MKEKLHKAIAEDRLDEAEKILQEYASRWFVFGVGIGIILSSTLYRFLLTK